MRKLVECVPNFSEGRNMDIINAIADEVRACEGVTLLDVDPGKDTNRTVVTFVGEPDAIKEAAFRAIKKASELIDMSKHKGAHARMGATDVCPFIPVSGMTMEECVELSKEVAKRVGEELKIPVYLYEYSAQKEERRNLANIRKGEYEGLAEKLKDPEWKPDFGPAEFNEKSGATVIGARDFLLAYNINLNTRDRAVAHDIALTIREAGRAKRDKNGKIVRDENGKAIKVPGLLKNCKAVGWYIDEYGYAQVSMNLTNYHVTNLHHAFETVSKEAEKRGYRVTGSEVVGLLPKDAILDAGKYYLEKQSKNKGIPEKEIIHTAILSLGLNDTSKFVPEEKIIEYKIEEKGGRLVDMDLTKFCDELSSDSPAPGGGSVAALSGAISASLASMVANLTYGKKGYERTYKVMEEVAISAQESKDTFLRLIDKDTEAFNNFMAVLKMPKKTEEDKAKRAVAMEEATKEATLTPLETMRETRELISLCEIVSKKGNKNALSDAAVGAIMAEAAAESAYLNVKINVPGIKDEKFVKEVVQEAEEILEELKKARKRIVNRVLKSL